jgi:hypothetical protein
MRRESLEDVDCSPLKGDSFGEVTGTGGGGDDFLLLLPKKPNTECLIDLEESSDLVLRMEGDDCLVDDAWSFRFFLWPTVSRVGSVHETSNMF